MAGANVTGDVAGYQTPKAFGKKKKAVYENESELTIDSPIIQQALSKIGVMPGYQHRALIARARDAHRFFPDSGSRPDELNLGIALQYLSEHPPGKNSLKEEEQPEPYDDATNSFAPGPRSRTEPSVRENPDEKLLQWAEKRLAREGNSNNIDTLEKVIAMLRSESGS
jgi:hypothetical protein